MSDVVTKQLVQQVSDTTKLSVEQSDFALNYVARYYHAPARGTISQDDLAEHIVTIQSQLGIEQTGILDSQLVKTLEYTPRCGVSDYAKSASGAKWGLKELTYFVEQYVNNLSKTDQDFIIQQAFDNWSAVADIKIKRTNNKQSCNIIVSTGRGRQDGFDGPNNTLAWAYLPPTVNFKGQLLTRFDLDETWVKSPNERGIVMLNVACHEFGHLLGLEHSRYKSALMAPYYSPNVSKPQAQDDVSRIQALYGKAISPTPTPTPGTKYKIEIEVDNLNQVKINGKNPVSFNLI
jgi:hypothetical protein